MIAECPRCRRKVALRGDGNCPGCGKSPSDIAGVDLDRVAIVLRSHANLPKVCYNCGQTADHTKRITESRRSPHAETGKGAALGLLGIVVEKIFQGGQTISIRVPVCGRCKSTKPEVDRVDWDNYRLTLIVHRRFRDQASESRTPNTSR